MMRSRWRPVLARALVVAGLLGAPLLGATSASAQWGWGLPAGPIPPGAIVRSLMNRGFIEIGRPRLAGDAYVVEGVNARGQRLRLVIDAYDGDLISRTRLDAPLLPPAEVGRARPGPADPSPGFDPGADEEIAPPGMGRGPGRDVGRERIDRGDLPPLPARRAERTEPPLTEPRRAVPPEAASNPAVKPAEPRRVERAQPQRQARKPDPAMGQPSLPPAKANPAEPQAAAPAPTPAAEAAKPEQTEPPAVTAAVPPRPPQEQRPAAPAALAPTVETPALPAAEAAPPVAPAQRTVRVIEGVTPVVPQVAPQKPDGEKKSEITPPAILE
ncbi:MAG TPA: hypothetical protein VF744_05880 [Beijerinckiaceae bacterium]